MPPAAVAGGSALSAVGGIAGAGIEANAARHAGDAQADAANHAAEIQKQMYDEQRSDLAPWRSAGTSALSQMQDPYFQKSFSMSDFQADPSYQFRMQQGMNALQGSAAARGGLLSGNTLQGITDYSQNAASQEYQNAYARFNNDQQSRFGRLSNIAGMGQNADQMTGTAARNYANQAGEDYIGAGNGQAAAYLGAGKAWGGAVSGIGNGMGANTMQFFGTKGAK